MPRRVEHHADVVLRLEVRRGAAQGAHLLHGGRDVVHTDVEVHLHLLIAPGGRPLRADVVLLQLEGQIGRGSLPVKGDEGRVASSRSPPTIAA